MTKQNPVLKSKDFPLYVMDVVKRTIVEKRSIIITTVKQIDNTKQT